MSEEVRVVLSEEVVPESEDIWDRGEHISLDGREEILFTPPRIGICEDCGKEHIIVTSPAFPLCEACDGARQSQAAAQRRKERKATKQRPKETRQRRRGGQLRKARTGVVVPGCPACRKRLFVLPNLVNKLSTDGKDG